MKIVTLNRFIAAPAPGIGCDGLGRTPRRVQTLGRAAMLLKCGVVFAFLVCALMSNAYAQLRPLPEKSGFSGFVNLGAGALRGESNLIAGTRFGEISKETIPSIFAKPDAESTGVPIVNFELTYTFAPRRTQLFFGNLLEDFVRFDFATQLGARYQFRNKTIFAGSLLTTSVPAEVWADPYVANQPRQDTDRTSTGVRLTLGRIAGTGLQVQYTQREIKIDDELSGLTGGLGLSPQQVALLDREGDLQRLQLTYYFKLRERHSLAPALWLTREDLDGEAMANDLTELYLTYLYNGKRFNFVGNVGIGTADYEKTNPIYNRKRDDDRTALSLTVFDKKLFGANAKWWGSLTVAGISEDANIDFYDTKMTVLTLSVFRLF